MKPIRADQLLSRYGYCSRSEARHWLRAGRVQFDDQPLTDAAEKVDPATVRVDGEAVERPEGLLALLHKPPGYVCSHDSREGPRVFDLVPARWSRRNPALTTIGRLDKDASGLLLLTDVGELVHHWTSPKHHVPKLYEVAVDRDLDATLITIFAAGDLVLDGETKPCLPARLEILGTREARLELTEGKYHQVKRMFASRGFTVTRLHRSRFGEYELGNLPVGQWRSLPLPDPA